ncbi:hypothetical protein LTR56_019779 [Elasticomyces elasticus]|nr:hypothetical protein LTR56_019779 [Elasticomyces elasticus]KAK3642575.1 hypothetical protein LTR22_016013 [Elasticomyces elasticus]KAK5745045.1 hypothetical protein LTS12_023281 [Elasticomyces elasticus]
MADDPPSPPSSELSSPPSIESDNDTDALSTARPAKRRKRNTKEPITTPFPRDDSQIPANDPTDWETISLSSDSLSSAPGSPSHSEWASRDDAQTECLWRDCPFGEAGNNDELVIHVQSTHCATGGPKRVKYICEWGECQRKTSSHPSGYALKAHMRSHTKEKPYYCALPECDKAFTRSDALSKHMRTVHEPEMPRGTIAITNPTDIATPAAASITVKPGGKGKQSKNTTNNNSGGGINIKPDPLTPHSATNPNEPSPASDNITYIPAHHPITGQPGFMIHYPPDIIFTAWESSIPADQLMGLLRRQLHWAEKEHRELEAENAELERRRRDEWELKEVLVDGVMESEWARAQRSMMDEEEDREGGWLDDIPPNVRELMEGDVEKGLRWGPAVPPWRRRRPGPKTLRQRYTDAVDRMNADVDREGGQEMRGAYEDAVARLRAEGEAEDERLDEEHERRHMAQGYRPETPGNDDGDEDSDDDEGDGEGGDGGLEPPPTGRSGGFDGERDPYDNYFEDQEARFEMLRAERERAKAALMKTERAGGADGGKGDAEMDAVGVLMGMGGRQG